MDDFLFRTPKQRAHKKSELVSGKKISWKKKSNQLTAKKKNIPNKAKNIAPSLAHKKEEDDKTISPMERIAQD